jgi:hypothetical protein
MDACGDVRALFKRACEFRTTADNSNSASPACLIGHDLFTGRALA